ncbi:cell division protein [Actinorhabdospora filicis]|uniref:Cell division protein n=1 Tax=Actinorhabdospora filicis TaxID=1785913 RepID=A0A9W6SFJ0_9ACTN|nr:penicillin-binding protein 2 [Actinorhabdospora filicis]GLZ75378.1 cell division protein [Actinorhabdospora filicis]
MPDDERRSEDKRRRDEDRRVVPLDKNRRGDAASRRRSRYPEERQPAEYPRRTVRRGTVRRTDRDPFRPALQLLDGGSTVKGGPVKKDGAARKTAPAEREAPRKGSPVQRPATGNRRPRPQQNPARRRRVIKRRLPRMASPTKRLRVGTVVLMLVFMVICGRLVQLQVTDAAAYAAAALDQRLTTEILPAERGSILDRNGRPLAFSADARYVYADPEMITDPQGVAGQLAPILGVPASELLPKLQRQKNPDGTPLRFVYLARGVDVEVGDRVEALNLGAVRARHDERRIVPGHDLAANVLGFTGDEGKGLVGLEAQWDDVLRGVDGKRTYERSNGPDGQEIPGGYSREEPARPGSSIQLTIDQDLQYRTQQILVDTMSKKNASFGAAVVMDVKTGEVVALASAPTYDAADPWKYDDKLMRDWAANAVVEPGSVHKAIVVSAALEEGLIKPGDSIMVAPNRWIGGNKFEDSHPHSERLMTLDGILAYSSNIGTIALADKLGPEKLYEYQQRYGLGAITGLGVAGEAEGIVRPPSTWQGADYGSIPIGLGVAVTPLQMAAAYAAIANGGTWVQPTLIKSTVAPDGTVTPAAAPKTHRVISQATSDVMRTLLQAPVAVPDGTGHTARLDGYLVAGKTGTGKLAKDGGYASGDVASFVGFAPADAPKYAVAVFAYTPGGGGGAVAGPAFRDIMAFTMGHFRVPPSTEPEPEFRLYG